MCFLFILSFLDSYFYYLGIKRTFQYSSMGLDESKQENYTITIYSKSVSGTQEQYQRLHPIYNSIWTCISVEPTSGMCILLSLKMYQTDIFWDGGPSTRKISTALTVDWPASMQWQFSCISFQWCGCQCQCIHTRPQGSRWRWDLHGHYHCSLHWRWDRSMGTRPDHRDRIRRQCNFQIHGPNSFQYGLWWTLSIFGSSQWQSRE